MQIVIVSNTNTKDGATSYNYTEAAKKVADFFFLDYIGLREGMGLNAFTVQELMVDDIHLNYLGSK